MRFDWHKFCIEYGVPFVTQGPNTAKGHISIKCPFCGVSDPSEHMGLTLDVRNPVWGCLRNARHRGRDPSTLVARLLSISYSAASVLVESTIVPVDEFERAVESLSSMQQQNEVQTEVVCEEIEKSPEFRLLSEGAYGKRFIDYLRYRGFDHDAESVATQYELWYALTGRFAWRVIFPIRDSSNRLVGWTGRAIQAGAARYLTSDSLPDVLLRFSAAEPSRMVVVCEGPMDAMKADYYGRRLGFGAVATLSSAVGRGRYFELVQLRRQTHRMCIVFDADAYSQGFRLAQELGALWVPLPLGVKDIGEMSGEQTSNFLTECGEKLQKWG